MSLSRSVVASRVVSTARRIARNWVAAMTASYVIELRCPHNHIVGVDAEAGFLNVSNLPVPAGAVAVGAIDDVHSVWVGGLDLPSVMPGGQASAAISSCSA